jgi:hypothetical protein
MLFENRSFSLSIRLVVFFVLNVLLVVPASAQTPKFDGNWWRDLHDGERVEFLAGFIDCYANDLRDKNNTFPDSWDTYAPRITHYYDSHPQKTARPVIRVLFDVRSPNPPKPTAGGEVWNERHWFFDGDYWGQMSKYEQIAYIDGYLSCYRKYLPSRPKKFSKLSVLYAERISGWFDAEPSKSPKLVSKRQHVAIAGVLYRFTDKTSSRK